VPRTAKPAVSAWIVRERKRLGLKPHDLAQRLSAMGLPVADGTPRTWEAGRSPSADNIEGLERIFGSAAPTERSGDGSTTAGLSALIEQISELVEELQLARQAQAEESRWFREALMELGVLRQGADASLIEQARAHVAEAEADLARQRSEGTPQRRSSDHGPAGVERRGSRGESSG